MSPADYVFCALPGDSLADSVALNAVAMVRESEGISLVVERSIAERAGLRFEGPFRMISLTIRTRLDSVGLTARMAGALASHGISANVIAGYFHDHVLVPAERGEEALAILRDLPAAAVAG